MRKNKVKILTVDIETSPICAYAWGPKWETNLIEFIDHSKILCFSAKWLDGKQTTKGLIDYKGYKKGIIDDALICKDLHTMFDEADIIVSQNGIDFDHKVVNSRLLKHNLTPPSPFKMVDTKKEAKRWLRLPSYSLDDMSDYFDLGRKLQHNGFELWKKCMAGDEEAWNTMKRYNAQDVKLTEKLYLKLRPFMKNHPNTDIYEEKGNCPKCSSSNVQSRGFLINNTTKYHRAQCMDCGGWYRFGKNLHKNLKPTQNI